MSNPLKKKMGGFSLVTDDILQNILSRLPALSFASSACVSKRWKKVCSRILCHPKLVSALSLNPSLRVAVREVLDKALCEPMRPDFAIAFVGLQFRLLETHQLITEILGSRTPVITNAAAGIIGMDAFNVLREVKWDFVHPQGPNARGPHSINNLNRGIVLVVGFVPGLKVDVIPLLRSQMEPEVAMVERFLIDIKDYSASVSGSETPAGIILFGDQRIDMKPVIAELDYAMPEETFIVGDARGYFLWESGGNSRHYHRDLYIFDAVGLVFATDMEKSPGTGKYQFHVTLSAGILPFGPQLRVVSVQEKGIECSWLTAKMEGYNEILDGEGLIDDINEEVEDECPHFYIGVTKYCSSGSEQLGLGSYLALYEVLGSEGEGFIVDGVGIKPGDSFLFYHTDSETAKSSCIMAYENLETLKASLTCKTRDRMMRGGDDIGEVFGGMIFACYSRGESFFGHPDIDSLPFWKNFPGSPVAGAFCLGEIGRASTSQVGEQSDEEESSLNFCLHAYSTVYLAMSYVPAPLEN